jgi:hypothetical protein
MRARAKSEGEKNYEKMKTAYRYICMDSRSSKDQLQAL